MSFIPSMFSGARGTGFTAQGANIVEAATKEQADQQYKRAQEALDQQQALVNALQAQGGIQKQSDVYNQYANLAAGNGPSVAQNQLAQATGANVANQAAMAAGQRGAGANVGLMSRQAAQAGAGVQQNAAGQLATLRAQEQLAAMGQQGALATQMVGQQAQGVGNLNQYTQNEQQQILNSIAQANQAKVGMQSNINDVMGASARQNAANQTQMFGQAIGAAGSLPGLFAGGGGGAAGATSPGGLGGGTKAFGATPPAAGLAHGGEITPPMSEPTSFAAKYLKQNFAHGGTVPAKVSPGEVYLSPDKVKKVAEGKKSPMAGEHIKGKAKVKGDSYKNDTVSKNLKEGGIVIPRSVTQSKDAPKKAAEFVAAILSKQNMKRK